MNNSKNLINTSMAAEILGFSSDYVRRLIRAGKIKAEKLGNDWIFTKQSISKIKRRRSKRKYKDDLENGIDQ